MAEVPIYDNGCTRIHRKDDGSAVIYQRPTLDARWVRCVVLNPQAVEALAVGPPSEAPGGAG